MNTTEIYSNHLDTLYLIAHLIDNKPKKTTEEQMFLNTMQYIKEKNENNMYSNKNCHWFVDPSDKLKQQSQKQQSYLDRKLQMETEAE